jgi:hypothetical protein
MFEGHIVKDIDTPEPERGFLKSLRRPQPASRRWTINEMPMKALIHLTTKLATRVDVFTFKGEEHVDAIERFLSRRGAAVTVHPAYDIMDLAEIVKFDRDIHAFYTTSQEYAEYIGMRATVVSPDGPWGF